MRSKHKRTNPIPNHKIPEEQKTNELFEKYYKQLNIVPEAEWDKFLATFRSDLPSTFRITGFGSQSEHLLDLLQKDFLNDALKSCSNGTEQEIELKSLDWYPRAMAWQLDAPKTRIRKDESLKKLHQFLISETENGSISRQEAVSMIPPLLLDIKHEHTILDLCAAPGSKSAQLIEMLHYDFEVTNKDPNVSDPAGCVLANDLEVTRCYMMTHQLKRLKSPCIIVTKEDASVYPKLYVPNPLNPAETKPLEFDRVLADVPCSGDGTLRKNPQIWFNWSPGQGIGEHLLQLRILKRGLELLRDDGQGLLVYSTCSLNPVEDEAVVAAMLTSSEGRVELVEPPKWFSPEGVFKALPGINTWNVMLKDGTIIDEWKDLPEKNKSSHKPSLFPPENAAELHLERCRRVLPHLNNTGGFFIAILRKLGPLPWMKAKTETVVVEGEKVVSKTEPAKKISKMKFRAENPYKYITAGEDKDWAEICKFYGIDESRFRADQILFRPSEDPTSKRHTFYYTNKRVKQIMELNAERGLSVINTGVLAFTLCDDKQYSGYRISQDGVNIAIDWIKERARVIVLDPGKGQSEDVRLLMDEEMPLVEGMSEATRNQWENVSVGPVVLECLPAAEGTTGVSAGLAPKCRMLLAGWRGQKSLRHYLKPHERSHFLRLCGCSDINSVLKYLKQLPTESSTNDVGHETKRLRLD